MRKTQSECDNSHILRAAAYNLADDILRMTNSLASDRINRQRIAKRIEGLAKNYGNRRVARFKTEYKP